MGIENRVLKSELAGVWYTEDPGALAREIDVYLDASESRDLDPVMALLLPHAGYRYSGMVAAAAVQQVRNHTYSRVIVLGVSHRMPLTECISLPDVDHIETPLGRVALDREVVEKLWEREGVESYEAAHSHEHSVQIELPFLQRALGEFKLVPVVCGQLSAASAKKMAEALSEFVDEETLVVVSSDFTHYGRSFDYVPFEERVKDNLRVLDMGAFHKIEERKADGFLDYIEQTGATICGSSAIAVLLSMLPDHAHVHAMKYDTSGNLTGDWSHCVSYLSAVVSGDWRHPARKLLSASDKTALLAYARNQIEIWLRDDVENEGLNITPPMEEVMGAFVTLHKQGRLRGCIGEIFPRRPLYEAVRDQAVNAAFHDPRFSRLSADELDDIDIEISALTIPRQVHCLGDIKIGTHGIVLKKADCSAVFLPQVAPEQGWGLAETLMHLCMKAGLPSDAWHDGCEFHVFEAIVFSEK